MVCLGIYLEIVLNKGTRQFLVKGLKQLRLIVNLTTLRIDCMWNGPRGHLTKKTYDIRR